MNSLKVKTAIAAIFCMGLGIALIVIGKLVLWISGSILILGSIALFWKAKSMLKEQNSSTEGV